MAVTYADLGIDIPGHVRSGNAKTFCPQCRDRRSNHRDRSLSVDLETGRWNCHYCGWSNYLENYNRDERTWQTQAKQHAVPVRPIPVKNPTLTGEARQFVERRRIPFEVAEQFRLYGDDRSINIPYIREGQLVNVKTRYFADGDDKAGHAVTAGAELVFWNLDGCRGEKTIAITEGEWDAIACIMAGIPAMSVPNGASKDNNNLKYFESGAEIIEQADRIIIATDSDENGMKLAADLVRRIGPAKCVRPTWSWGKDANDVLVRWGADRLRGDLDYAAHYPVEGLIRPLSLREKVHHLYHHGVSRGHSTGYPSLDHLYTIMPGYITLVTGIPGSGKSELIDQFAVNTGRALDWRWVIFSPEGQPTEDHISRMLEKLAIAPFFDGPTPRMSWDQAEKHLAWMEQHVTFMDPEEPTMECILDLARADMLRNGANCLVIDPWNELIHLKRRDEREDEYLSRVIRDYRRFNEQHVTHGFVVNHPHQVPIDQKTGQYPVIRHYDLAGGSMWANKVAAMLSVWRNRVEKGQPVDINVIKAKTRRIGTTGKASFRYDTVTGVYTDLNLWELAG